MKSVHEKVGSRIYEKQQRLEPKANLERFFDLSGGDLSQGQSLAFKKRLAGESTSSRFGLTSQLEFEKKKHASKQTLRFRRAVGQRQTGMRRDVCGAKQGEKLFSEKRSQFFATVFMRGIPNEA